MTADPARWAWAWLACAAWLGLLVPPLHQQWRTWRNTRTVSAGAPLLIAYASQSGFGAQLAHDLACTLAAHGCPAQALPLQRIRAEDLAASERMLFIASTTGEGDAPDNAGAFVTRVMQGAHRLQRLQYGLLALGDSRYAGFCRFGRELDAWLRAAGATPAFARVEADGGNTAALASWAQAVAQFTGSSPNAAASASAIQRWALAQRSLLNPGSPGAPIHRIVLQPLDPAPHWQAGDIARIHLPGQPVAWRDYTLASLPHEGEIQLLVREARRTDGQRGLGSGWLGHGLAIGGEVRVQIRRNSGFHGPEATAPLVLIGNGTGLAGLAVHLKEREHAQRAGLAIGPAWLLFGERTHGSDALCDAALQAWLASGVLQRLDRAFSRDADASSRYVQDLLGLHGALLRDWVARGAALYVCGQREGMAQGVDAALRAQLGAAALAQLAADGRYRRDVY
ncbi:oxidoreductase [Pseudorhodoferax aquiterrae]|uniref:NADPH--hemoprotein reductase n=1 Tax=Pseudorhodoferax aquiterrae TaxID=747304 RepID=A0ABQ3G8V4_9BURK|nr:sulfite reductase subunit alpha [Pseudorhodoferax aquiterrae]GHC97420.1 oxidoreductase [Pseudorhodoferax aquiterrae]